MFKTYSKRFVCIISTVVFSALIGYCCSEAEKEYIYHNWCEDSKNSTMEPIPCEQNRGVVMSLNVSKSEVNVVTFMLPPVDPIAIIFDQNYCTHPKGSVSPNLFYSFSNSKPSDVDNDGILETKNKTVIKRPNALEPTIVYIGIEGEQDLNTICFHLSIGPEFPHSYGSTFHVSKDEILIQGEVSGYLPKYLTIYNPDRAPISVQLFQITFSNISIGGFYSFTKHVPDPINHDGVLNTNNETVITWPSSLLSQKTYEPAIYIAIENIKEVEGNSTFLLDVKSVNSVQESPGFWAKWFGWLG